MDQSCSNSTYIHRIDKNDVIIKLSGNWKSFAEKNSGADTCLAENLIGTSLWDHIRDPETRN